MFLFLGANSSLLGCCLSKKMLTMKKQMQADQVRALPGEWAEHCVSGAADAGTPTRG